MRIAIFSLLFFLLSPTFAQKGNNPHASIPRIPDSSLQSISTFAEFLKSNLADDFNRIQAIYYWVGRNIIYDVENMYKIDYVEKPDELIERTFRTKKAICQGYSELFNELCNEAGIVSYVVHGYTKQFEKVQETGHAWVIAKVDGKWYGFDPTWGAGYIRDGRFYKSFTWDYFMVPPKEFAWSHMPFDPIWQCLEYPLSVDDFYSGVRSTIENAYPMNFNDSIIQYSSIDSIQQCKTTLARVEQTGVYNSITADYTKMLRQNIENDRLLKEYANKVVVVDLFNQASKQFNEAAHLFNEYISFYNHQFRPSKTDREIRNMIDTCSAQLKRAKQILSKVTPFDKSMQGNVVQLSNLIQDLQKNIDEQRIFVSNYISTPRPFRAGLFRSR